MTDTLITSAGHGSALVRGFRFAESVLPGHPDKLADQIADGIVDIALAVDDRAIVQVEVAVHEHVCHVNGRCSTAGGALDREYVEGTIRAVYERAGFGVPFDGVGSGDDYQCPRGSDIDLHLTCTIDEANPEEHAEREHADDQAIHVGYAIGSPETRWLPLEQHLALVLRDRVLHLTATERALGAGPDGKILVALRPAGVSVGGVARSAPARVVVSVQHVEDASLVRLERALRATVLDVLANEAARMHDLLAAPDADCVVHVNASGVFTLGGPMNDNGQTGRKLVCDFYGPHVAIGGGALSGKDPWRLDRAGALRARQLAVAMVETGFVREARATLAWAPRDQRPSGVLLEADGRVLDAATTARWVERFDPSLAATHEELGLAHVNWENCARVGHFGRGMRWDAGRSAH